MVCSNPPTVVPVPIPWLDAPQALVPMEMFLDDGTPFRWATRAHALEVRSRPIRCTRLEQ